MKIGLLITHNTTQSLRDPNLKHQRLAIKIIPTRISIRQLSPIHEPILRNEIIITQTKQEKLITTTINVILRINRRKRDRLPLLIEQARILLAAIVEPEARELRVDVEIQPGAVLGGGDVLVQHRLGRGDGARRAVVGSLDVRRRRDVEHVDVAVHGLRARLAVARAAVAGQN